MAKQELATKTDNLPATAGYDYGQYAGAGFENQTKDDYSIPFLAILQSNSKEVKSNESARGGMLMNTVTKELYSSKEGVAFVPCYTQHMVCEWIPLDAGGGFVASHERESELGRRAMANKTGKTILDNGNELVETFYVYGLIVNEDETTSPAVINFTSTKIKKYRAWNTTATSRQLALPDGRRVKLPLFAHVYRLKTVLENGKKGDYFNFDIKFNGESAQQCMIDPSSPLFADAVAMLDMARAGNAKVDHSAAQDDSAAAGDEFGGNAAF